MISLYAQIDMSTPGSGIGTVINTVQSDPATVALYPAWTWVDISALSPQPAIGYTYDGSVFTAPPAPTPPPLNQQYTKAQYGAYIIEQLNAAVLAENLTSAQNFALVQTLAPYMLLAQLGSLETLLAELPNIPVDGVMVTTTLITQATDLLEAYLSGS